MHQVIGFERRALHRRAAGFTLLEVLVAIVVLSFGVLGMVGLQAAALQSNKEARYQSAAARLARDLADLMRDNKTVAVTTSAATNPYLFTYNGTLPAAPPCYASMLTTACATTQDIANFHVRDWLTRVQAELPGARVAVCFDATPYAPADGRPQWDCSNSGGVAVVKIGWTQRNLNGSGLDRAVGVEGDSIARPIVVMALVAGSTQ